MGFNSYTDEQIILFIRDKALEKFGEEVTDVDVDELWRGLTNSNGVGYTVEIIKQEHSFAVVEYQAAFQFSTKSYIKSGVRLAYIFVDPNFERRGLGSKLLELVQTKFSDAMPLTLLCIGSGRESFFSKNKFVLEHSENDKFEMKYSTESTSWGK